MVEKRKLPARAAARAEQSSKRRTLTPPETGSLPPEKQPTPAEETPPPAVLPKSIQAGKPLPTVEVAQSEDLPTKDFQSVQESGVLSESLTRSRQKWISEGIFEKYWTKPTKRKGVWIEEPNNPSKDSMTKVGAVTITVEPHVFEATMFVVKDPKPVPPPAPTTTAIFRPILQYGPPNGAMPPPPTPTAPVEAGAPAAEASSASPQASGSTANQPPDQPAREPTAPSAQAYSTAQTSQEVSRAAVSHPVAEAGASSAIPTPAAGLQRPAASPRGMESMLSPITVPSQPTQQPLVPPQVTPGHMPSPSPSLPPAATSRPGTSSGQAIMRPPMAGPMPGAPISGVPVPSAPGAKPMAAGTDPIILTLAEKATEDPELRELMKRVAQGDAAKQELQRFQAIIDEITAESKKRGTSQGPSADRLIVDGRTVRYFADEVNVIVDIVLRSNPKQTSADLRPPAGSDPLVVLLVKNALDEQKTKDMVRRIAENRAQFSDATDLKAVLDRLKGKLQREREALAQSPVSSGRTTPTTARPNGLPHGHAHLPGNAADAQAAAQPQQAIRSKPIIRVIQPDISAVVFEFAGGTGDRYLFPKFSILEYLPVTSANGAAASSAQGQGHQVVASFLIVRRGSATDYPDANPTLDYYQPVTIRLYAPAGRYLEHLARVVAPQDEVRRYMDDIMQRMTRAEYVLLAMRLPRNSLENGNGKDEGSGEESKDGVKDKAAKEKDGKDGKSAGGGFQFVNSNSGTMNRPNGPQGAALWTAKATLPRAAEGKTPPAKPMDADEQYQALIASVSRREAEEAA